MVRMAQSYRNGPFAYKTLHGEKKLQWPRPCSLIMPPPGWRAEEPHLWQQRRWYGWSPCVTGQADDKCHLRLLARCRNLGRASTAAGIVSFPINEKKFRTQRRWHLVRPYLTR